MAALQNRTVWGVVAVIVFLASRRTSLAPMLAFAVLLAVLYCRFWHPKAPSYYYGYAWWGMSIPCDRLGRLV